MAALTVNYMLANTLHTYPAFFIGGWLGIAASMVVEFTAVVIYLRKLQKRRWIFGRFVLANVLSALAGLPIFVTTYYFPSGTAKDNIHSLAIGISFAFIATILIESAVFLFHSQPTEHYKLVRAVIMSNFYSYSLLVAIHLITI